MGDRLTIALDAMGGDDAPGIVIDGANLALTRFPQVDFLLFGPEEQLEPLVRRAPKLQGRARIVHTDVVVSGDAKPSLALRNGRQSSMRLAINAVHDGQAAGVVSAGNTGALMAMAKLVLRTLPGIDRPAICSFFPTLRGESVMLDLGANIECDADNLFQFAVMGEVFSRTVLGLARPTVGLLNVGAEDQKGHEALRIAGQRLRDAGLPIAFHGFIEGNDIATGTVDVIVTDGFTGNVALKTAEGTVKLFTQSLRAAFLSSPLASVGYFFARPALRKLRRRLDPRRYNGAVFLGLNGIAVKSHGGADALGFANAIGVAVDMALHGFLDTVREEFEHLQPTLGLHPPAAVAP
ncbi:phosphate acyltransferase PlsX [Stella sp.]|uniref:phosphate acyltransferase PlsX n=1 Tax=Stella sp. TaxID=2912054 RepID=UPI0035B45BB9